MNGRNATELRLASGWLRLTLREGQYDNSPRARPLRPSPWAKCHQHYLHFEARTILSTSDKTSARWRVEGLLPNAGYVHAHSSRLAKAIKPAGDARVQCDRKAVTRVGQSVSDGFPPKRGQISGVLQNMVGEISPPRNLDRSSPHARYVQPRRPRKCTVR